MRIIVRVTDDGRTFEGDAELKEVTAVNTVSASGGSFPKKTRPVRPSEAVEHLYETGFFAKERTLGEAITELRTNGYNFNPPSTLMALGGKSYLQRRGSKGSYRYVQKYPPR